MLDPVPKNFQPIDAAKRFTKLTGIFVGEDPADAVLALVRRLHRERAEATPSSSPPSILRLLRIPRPFPRQPTEAIVGAFIRYYSDLRALASTYTPTDKEAAFAHLAFLATHLRNFAASDRAQYACARHLFLSALSAFPDEEYGATFDACVEWFDDEPFRAARGLADIMEFARNQSTLTSVPHASRLERPLTRLLRSLRGIVTSIAPPAKRTKTAVALLCYAAHVHDDQEWVRPTWPKARRALYLAIDRLATGSQRRRRLLAHH